jgi:hypothetical protein
MHDGIATSPATATTSPTIEVPVARTIDGTVHHYGWTRSFVYEELSKGSLRAVQAGRRTLITTESADRLFKALPGANYRAPRGTAT